MAQYGIWEGYIVGFVQRVTGKMHWYVSVIIVITPVDILH